MTRVTHESSADALLNSIVSDIERRIQDRDLMPGDKLPSENEISRTYMASRFIVRRAFRRLENSGWVDAVQGRGRFVKCRPLQFNLKKHAEVQPPVEKAVQFDGEGLDYRSTVLQQVIRKASPDLAQSMSLKKDAEVFCIERLLYFNDIPSALLKQHIPLDRFPKIKATFAQTDGSVSTALIMSGVTHYERGDIKIKAFIPGAYERDMFGTAPHIPFLEVRQVCFDCDGTIEYQITQAPSGRIELQIFPH